MEPEHVFKPDRIYLFKIDYYKTNCWKGRGFHSYGKITQGDEKDIFIVNYLYYDKEEKNETAKEALKRELLEELDINVNINNIKEFYGNNSQHTIEKNGKIINLTLFIIKTWKGELKPKINIHSELAYVNINKLDTFKDMISGDSVFIPAIKIAL